MGVVGKLFLEVVSLDCRASLAMTRSESKAGRTGLPRFARDDAKRVNGKSRQLAPPALRQKIVKRNYSLV